VKYSNTNPDIAAEDGGAHGEKIDWKVCVTLSSRFSLNKSLREPSAVSLHLE
jgi:hypothetical protein